MIDNDVNVDGAGLAIPGELRRRATAALRHDYPKAAEVMLQAADALENCAAWLRAVGGQEWEVDQILAGGI